MSSFRSRAAYGVFPPEQEQALRHQLQAAPDPSQSNASRWSLGLIRGSVDWLADYSLSGIWRLLRALKLHYKRGQQHIHSPDPSYALKAAEIRGCIQAARDDAKVVTLFLDEFSFHRWAEEAPVYAAAGRKQPKVDLPCRYNTTGRTVAVINAVSGQVLYRLRSHITVAVLVEVLVLIRASYAQAQTIYVIQDNWHQVHFHPRQVAAAQRENITLVSMPTYAPWLNPIEKLWRKLKQDVLLMHRDGNDWEQLKARVIRFLDQYASASPDLLRYVGLLPG